jgi:hypothetical protein
MITSFTLPSWVWYLTKSIQIIGLVLFGSVLALAWLAVVALLALGKLMASPRPEPTAQELLQYAQSAQARTTTVWVQHTKPNVRALRQLAIARGFKGAGRWRRDQLMKALGVAA